MLLHAKGSTVWKLRQFWSVQALWRYSVGKSPQYVCETVDFYPIKDFTSKIGKIYTFLA